jgi:hypothetical protein
LAFVEMSTPGTRTEHPFPPHVKLPPTTSSLPPNLVLWAQANSPFSHPAMWSRLAQETDEETAVLMSGVHRLEMKGRKEWKGTMTDDER